MNRFASREHVQGLANIALLRLRRFQAHDITHDFFLAAGRQLLPSFLHGGVSAQFSAEPSRDGIGRSAAIRLVEVAPNDIEIRRVSVNARFKRPGTILPKLVTMTSSSSCTAVYARPTAVDTAAMIPMPKNLPTVVMRTAETIRDRKARGDGAGGEPGGNVGASLTPTSPLAPSRPSLRHTRAEVPL